MFHTPVWSDPSELNSKQIFRVFFFFFFFCLRLKSWHQPGFLIHERMMRTFQLHTRVMRALPWQRPLHHTRTHAHPVSSASIWFFYCGTGVDVVRLAGDVRTGEEAQYDDVTYMFSLERSVHLQIISAKYTEPDRPVTSEGYRFANAGISNIQVLVVVPKSSLSRVIQQ